MKLIFDRLLKLGVWVVLEQFTYLSYEKRVHSGLLSSFLGLLSWQSRTYQMVFFKVRVSEMAVRGWRLCLSFN